jgi:GntR family transcriptional regulator
MDRIRTLVRAGEIQPGATLPPVRQLASDLEVNANTVAKAYSLLEREGVVETARRRGTVVAPSAPEVASRSVNARLHGAVARLLEEATSVGVNVDELLRILERQGRPHDRQSERRSR